jgi:glycosyltransferase involved in cell wall biosynthesis
VAGSPTISVVVPAYNAERWLDETLTAVLGQTDPADEVVLVDDGSTDATLDIARRHEPAIRVISQPNAGCGYAFNAAIAAATGDYVALCPADDLWVPQKLEWQRATLAAHPEVDVSFGAAVNFGDIDDPFPRPARAGVQDPASFLREMFVRNVVPDPSVVLRRELHRRLGGFVAAVGEDYEFHLRALRAGATFHFDERVLVRLRQHGGNLSSRALEIWEMNTQVHRAAAPDVGDPALARRVLARDLRRVGRCRLGLGLVAEARSAYVESARHHATPATAGAIAVLSVPGVPAALNRVARARRERAGAV